MLALHGRQWPRDPSCYRSIWPRVSNNVPTVPGRVVIFRSIFRGRLLYSTPGWLLEETSAHVVTAIVPGAETLQLVTPRANVMREVAAGREQTALVPWHTNRVVWLMPFNAAHAIGLFWNDASDEFAGYYINLQAPLRRTPIGYDSSDHVLDIVVAPDGSWRWKDEDEFEEAIQLGLFTPNEAADIRAEGERVITRLSNLLPTGWENWRPPPHWSVSTLRLPEELSDGTHVWR
jgi:predicted RNA-binding protein associated with RNAse of E/G family